jgi:hypothetical protein
VSRSLSYRYLLWPLLVVVWITTETIVPAAVVTRGPYLQSSTERSVIIRWRTDEPTSSVVSYGANLANFHQVRREGEPTTEHIVEVTGLAAATQYFYSVGNDSETLAGGPDYYFLTHPSAGTSKATRIWVIGDCGTFNLGVGKQAEVRDAYYQFADRPTDVWLALGDNAYYSGTDAEYQANFFEVYPALLRNTTLWSTIGNHETYSAVGDQMAYFDIFTFPTLGEAGGVESGTERYYSFEYGNIHFICLDSELSDRTPTGPMLSWLRADLEANAKDWVIAFWHSPPYSKGSHDSDNLFDNFGNMIDMRVNAVQLLESYGVDLVLCGHSHIYERSYLLNGHYGFSDSLAPHMLKDAGSGRPDDTGAYRKPGLSGNEGAVYVVAGSSGWATFQVGTHPAMYFTKLEAGSMVIDVDGSRLEAKFLRDDGVIDDHFTILKGEEPEALRVCTFAVRDGEATVTWKSLAGESYLVERATELKNAVWLPASERVVATGATTSWKEPVSPETTQSFYRVVQLPKEPVPSRSLLPPPSDSAMTQEGRSPKKAGKRVRRGR